ncbi:hypothetical protein RNAN_0105 [Rheinheimera nanhaiensis E407-8]|uniref:Uncharacterized protein n=1 Tax=Rheinheimera nanhaiensis E407-8 TaxID=562729 RepID=I1DSW4_9GAMM|nr:hypothetical protein RNAN_0105 [Rheinheimera nanhaiensis E407-8]
MHPATLFIKSAFSKQQIYNLRIFTTWLVKVKRCFVHSVISLYCFGLSFG